MELGFSKDNSQLVANVQKQLEVCDQLIIIAKEFAAEGTVAPDKYRSAALSLVTIKNQNRQIYLGIDTKRTDVERHRDRVDRLQLDLENLLYKQAYLTREIKQCRSLSTSELNILETEIGHKVGVTIFTENLGSLHERSLSIMSNETAARKEMLGALQHLNQKHQSALDRLDRKRKFIDELPTRVALVKTATSEISSQFASLASEDILFVQNEGDASKTV